jgi:hypothetical protein
MNLLLRGDDAGLGRVQGPHQRHGVTGYAILQQHSSRLCWQHAETPAPACTGADGRCVVWVV